MSDTPEGSDWWQASDDKWYPGPAPAATDVVDEDVADPAVATTVTAVAVDSARPEESMPAPTPRRRRNAVLVAAIVVVALVAALAGALLADDGDDPATSPTTVAGRVGGNVGGSAGDEDPLGAADPAVDGAGSGTGVPVTTVPTGSPASTEAGAPGAPPASSPAPEPTLPTGTTSPSPTGGVTALVGATGIRWDNDPCVPADKRTSRPYFAAPPDQACASPSGWLAHGTSAQLVCTTSGITITDAQGNSSSAWARLAPNNAGDATYMNVLFFMSWSTLESRLPGC